MPAQSLIWDALSTAGTMRAGGEMDPALVSSTRAGFGSLVSRPVLAPELGGMVRTWARPTTTRVRGRFKFPPVSGCAMPSKTV